MVTKEEAKAVDKGIEQAEGMLTEMPKPIRKRIVELKAYPDEVVTRIKQTNGVLVEFEERM